MKTLKLFPLVLFVLLLFVSAPLAGDKTDPAAKPAPSVVYKAATPISAQAGEYDLLSIIFEFPPGSGFPTHFHGGHALAVVLSGEITLREKGSEKVIKAGESFTENPGATHSAVNTGSTTARVAVSMLLPKGAEPTTVIEKQP